VGFSASNHLAAGALYPRDRGVGRHSEEVERILRIEFELAPAHELDVVGVGPGRLNHPLDGLAVVRRPRVEQIERALLVVEMGVEVRDKHRNTEVGAEEVGELADRGEVADMHLASRRVADIDRRIVVGQQSVELLVGDDLGRVPCHEPLSLRVVHTLSAPCAGLSDSLRDLPAMIGERTACGRSTYEALE